MKKNDKSSNSNDSPGTLDPVYTEERKLLIAGQHQASRDRDKWLLTLAAGAFGLSLTFVDRLDGEALLSTRCWLLYSWICFGATIVLMLISIQFSEKQHEQFRELLDKAYRNSREDDNWLETYGNNQGKNRLHWWIGLVNSVGLVVFLVGVAMLCVFAFGSISAKEFGNGRATAARTEGQRDAGSESTERTGYSDQTSEGAAGGQSKRSARKTAQENEEVK